MIFFKTAAAGNTFLHVAEEESAGTGAQARGDLARRLCDEGAGAGADGMIFYRRAMNGAAFSIYNRDGSTAEVSGNGMAGLAALLFQLGYPAGEIVLSSEAGERRARLVARDGFHFRLQLELGKPDFENHRFFPFLDAWRMEYEQAGLRFQPVSMGNPHAVVLVESWPAGDEWVKAAKRLQAEPVFPHGVNVEFAQSEAPGRCRVLFYERGVGQTLSSGTGSAAVFAVLRRLRQVEDRLIIDAPGGRFSLSGADAIFLETEAQIILKGDIF